MDPLVGASIITGGTSLVGGLMSGLFGSSSQDSANQTNLQIARETNEQNKQLYYDAAERQDKWNERQYEEYWKQREYDSLANQLARYKDIGINPYFALGNLQGGQAAGSTPSPSSQLTTPNLVSPEVRPYDPTAAIRLATRGISDAVDSYYSNSAQREQTRQLAIKNMTQLDRDIAELEKTLNESKVSGAQADDIRERVSQLKEMRKDIVKKAHLDVTHELAAIRNMDSSTEVNQTMADANRLNNEMFRNTSYYQKQRIIFGVDELLSRIKSNNASSAEAVASRFLKLCEANGVKIDNYQKNQINWLIRRGLKLDNIIKSQDAGLDGKWYTGKYNVTRDVIRGVVNGAGAAAGAYIGARAGKKSPKSTGSTGNGYYSVGTPTM